MKKRRLISFFLFLLLALTLQAANKRFTLVIDAGHGGKDHGAPGAISEEKNLTLKYALAFGRLVEAKCPDVKVIYTRTTDTYLTLHERAEIANRNNADLFISIHINALDGIHTARGFQSYTLGRGETTGDKGLKMNADVAKRENSVIFLESNYKTVYANLNGNAPELDIMGEIIADQNRERSVYLSRLMQQEVCKATGRQNGGSHQNNLAVLRLTKMPAILLELGFISTPDEENYMNTEDGHTKYPMGFYNAFIRYKEKYDNSIDVPYRVGAEGRRTPPAEPIRAPGARGKARREEGAGGTSTEGGNHTQGSACSSPQGGKRGSASVQDSDSREQRGAQGRRPSVQGPYGLRLLRGRQLQEVHLRSKQRLQRDLPSAKADTG